MNAVDAYVAALSPARAERVGAVVALMRAQVPQATESIDWGMPVWRMADDRYFAVADRARYVSLYLGCRPELCAEVLASDPKLRGGKGCVNVTDARAMPMDALADAVGRLFA